MCHNCFSEEPEIKWIKLLEGAMLRLLSSTLCLPFFHPFLPLSEMENNSAASNDLLIDDDSNIDEKETSVDFLTILTNIRKGKYDQLSKLWCDMDRMKEQLDKVMERFQASHKDTCVILQQAMNTLRDYLAWFFQDRQESLNAILAGLQAKKRRENSALSRFERGCETLFRLECMRSSKELAIAQHLQHEINRNRNNDIANPIREREMSFSPRSLMDWADIVQSKPSCCGMWFSPSTSDARHTIEGSEQLTEARRTMVTHQDVEKQLNKLEILKDQKEMLGKYAEEQLMVRMI